MLGTCAALLPRCIGGGQAPRSTGVGFIARLYEIEKRAKALDDDARRALRQRESVPILRDIASWLKQSKRVALPKTPTGQAIHYAESQWDALNRYVEHGWLAIDNNVAERALRPIAIGRKNWLFAGSDQGGERAAIMYTMVMSAKRHELDVLAYLTDVLQRLPSARMSEVPDFLPDRWKAKRNGAVL